MFGKLFGSKDEAPFEGEVKTADLAFRESVLLMKLLEAEGSTESAKATLIAASAKWRQSLDPRLRTTGISPLRFLFKAMHVAYSKPLLARIIHDSGQKKSHRGSELCYRGGDQAASPDSAGGTRWRQRVDRN
ncbi:MAG: hypothetical protein CV088_21245 [Nitrospira sp. LK70]|nr:hypothetical protein [Nitrospira sp. LK70]